VSAVPPPPPAPPEGNGVQMVELKVSKRILWVAGAAYPVRGITRIHTFVLRPRIGEAFVSFLKWAVLTAVATVLLQALTTSRQTFSQYEDEPQQWPWIVGALVAAILLVRLLAVMMQQPKHVLAVETASGSTALVTLPNPQFLHNLVHDLAAAIENPDSELHMLVDSLQINPSSYYFGDTVNMYGTHSSTGMKK
jgi:hypothetical protein